MKRALICVTTNPSKQKQQKAPFVKKVLYLLIFLLRVRFRSDIEMIGDVCTLQVANIDRCQLTELQSTQNYLWGQLAMPSDN